MHSSASATSGGVALQTQYFATVVASRRNGTSSSSYARASRSASTVAASESMHRSASTFSISGCSASEASERRAMRGVMRGLRDRTPHQAGRAEHAVEPRVHDHLDDRRDAATLLADTPRPRALEPDLRRRVRAVAELVLQPVDVERVAPAVREDARQQVARQPARRLREDEERVAHRRRAEPLVRRAASPRRLPPAARRSRSRARPSRPAAPSSPCRTAHQPCPPPAGAQGRRRSR